MLRVHMVKYEMLDHLQPNSSFCSPPNNPYSVRRAMAHRRIGECAAPLCLPWDSALGAAKALGLA